MCHACKEKWQTAYDGMELTNKYKIRKLGKKGNLQILGYLVGWYYQTSGNQKKNLKRISQN